MIKRSIFLNVFIFLFLCIFSSYALGDMENVNENWSVNCTTDQIEGTKRCFAVTSGESMRHDGTSSGRFKGPLKIIFANGEGPYVQVGFHTYPGRTPMVRVDENEPIEVHHDPGASKILPNPELVKQMRSGEVARARYHVWPEGAEEMYIDLTGFEEAWKRLNQLRKE